MPEIEKEEEPPVLECEVSNESAEPEVQTEEVKPTEANSSDESPMAEETKTTDDEEDAQSRKRHIEEIVSDNVAKKLKTITEGDQVVPPKKVSCEE